MKGVYQLGLHLHQPAECFGGIKAAKAATDNHYLMRRLIFDGIYSDSFVSGLSVKTYFRSLAMLYFSTG